MQALEKTKCVTSFPGGDLCLLTPDLYPMVLDYMRSDYLPSATTFKALDIDTSHPFVEMMFTSIFQQNISLVLLCADHSEVMGLRCIRVINSNEEINPDEIDYLKMRKWAKLWISVDEVAKFFEHYKVEESVHMFGLGVAKKYRHQGLATKLMQAALNFLGNLEISPLPIKGDATSNYTKRVYEKTGFEFIQELCYADYKVDGEQVICNTGDNKSIRVYGMVLN